MIAKPLKHNALGLVSEALIIGGVLFAKTPLHALKSLFDAIDIEEKEDKKSVMTTRLNTLDLIKTLFRP
jgi:hypothetical protein